MRPVILRNSGGTRHRTSTSVSKMSTDFADVKLPARDVPRPPSTEAGDGPGVVTSARVFSLRIVHLDYYMAAPLPGMDDCYSHFQGRGILEVPVVRIFGSTTSGQKTCLHLHKALPYFYVAYDEDVPQEVNEALAYVRRLASAVEKALKVASSLGAKRQHVHSCSLVRGRKFYGYYPNEQFFVKIVLYYPQEISRMSTLLLSGGIMNHKFQPYEAHIPYLLQILIDNNLYGMGHLHLSSLRFRNPLPGCSSDLPSVVENVRAEFLHKAAAGLGQAISDQKVSMNVELPKECTPEAKQVESMVHLQPLQTKTHSPCTFPVGSEPTSSGSRQSTPITGTPPELWMLGRVPGQWLWPALDSSQSRYSRKTTCELEADASVQDILNRGERLFRPLQETGPEVKMVQSLTQIWEEELRRSGEGGPAGPVDTGQYQPTARMKPSLSTLEQAMRDVLFQIAKESEHQIRSDSDGQECTPSSDAKDKEVIGHGEELTVGSLKNMSLLAHAGQQRTAFSGVGTLLAHTQAANGDGTYASPELRFDPFLVDAILGSLGSQDNSDAPRALEEAPVFEGSDDNNDDASAIDQEAIESHLSQRLQSQELENEVADFLRWLGATQDAEDDEIDEDDGSREAALSQLLSSPGMDSALLQALSEYENVTEKECQAILDCAAFNDDENAIGFSDISNNNESASTSNIKSGHASSAINCKDKRTGGRMFIPQTDGSFDEEDLPDKVVSDEASSGAKKGKVYSDEKATSRSHFADKGRDDLHGSSSEGASLREMMRRRRERRPHQSDASDSPSSTSEDIANVLKDVGQEKHGVVRGSGRTTSRKSEKALDVSSKAGSVPGPGPLRDVGAPRAKMGRGAVRKYSGRERGTKIGRLSEARDHLRKEKYAALPLVSVKNERLEEILDPRYEDTLLAVKRPRQEPLFSKGSLLPEAHDSIEDKGDISAKASNSLLYEISPRNINNFAVSIGGDDRDCGGGHQRRTNFPHPERDQHHKRVQGKPSLAVRPYQLSSVKMEIDEDFREMDGADVKIKSIIAHSFSEVHPTHNEKHTSKSTALAALQEFPASSNIDETNLSARVFSTSDYQLKGSPSNEGIGVDITGLVQSTCVGEVSKAVSRDSEEEVIPRSTTYHFTDMLDDSQESSISDESMGFGESEGNNAGRLFEGSPFSENTSQDSPVKEEEQIPGPTEDVIISEAVQRDTSVAFPSPETLNAEIPEPSLSSPRAGNDYVASTLNLREFSLEGTSTHQPSSVPGQSSMFTRLDSLGNIKSHPSSSPNELLESDTDAFQRNSPSKGETASGEPRKQQTSEVPSLSPSEREATTQIWNKKDMADMHAHHLVSKLPRFFPNVDRTDGISTGLQNSPLCPLVEQMGSEMFSLKFHRRPPGREQVREDCRNLRPTDSAEGAVYYGNVKDVPDHPAVMAGLIFDVKSRQPIHLRPFGFGGDSKRGKFEDGSRTQRYVEEDSWASHHGMDSVIGIPSHFENDGTVSYFITPAKSPPTPRKVALWASSMQATQLAGASKNTERALVGGQMFTMDANTGKLVPLEEIGKAGNSQEPLENIDMVRDEGDFERPASPKYDETHVFNLSRHSPALRSRDFSPGSRPDTMLPATVPSKESSLNSSPEAPKTQLKRALLPCTTTKSADRPPLAPGDKTSPGRPLPETLAVGAGSILPQDAQTGSVGPPARTSLQEGRQHVRKLDSKSPGQWRDISQMTAIQASKTPTPLSQAGFQDPSSTGGGQQVTLMSIEVFAETRGDLLPDPRYDAIGCIVAVIHEDGGKAGNVTITIVLIRDQQASNSGRNLDGIRDCEAIYLPDEVALIKSFTRLVHRCDPDMLLGWEIQGYSLGLLAERAANLGISLLKQLSRILPVSKASDVSEKEGGGEEVADLFDKLPLEAKGGDEPVIEDEWGRTHGSGLHVGGRIVLNIWRIMRGEVKLGIYSLEAVAEAVLRRRVPRIPWRTLTRWFSLGPGGRFRCLEYFMDRARLNLQIMDQLDLVNRTAELARIFGIDFYSVYSRGSQFRVESMMARLAHTQNYILVSPTRQQVADQPAMACLPLVMEPESRFYTSPVIVLDFQSLYPSMIIAYNLCFSTCLGKLITDNPKVLGVTQFSVQPGLLDSLKECMTICPNGVMFTPAKVRPGVLPRLLQEILSTRIMVKKAMKGLAANQRVLQRVLNARQFALKLIANVTYGYTAAGFSGRMPCAEIADSIVQCGRLTLERAIQLVNSHPRWRARVVYGDTDSMFVLLEGRTRAEAHAIGQEIAAAVTETNPPPVTLKMEKVYHPCVLLTKKRYVGYSYESSTQTKPIFDAKGIETIRRDSCPAVAKTLEYSLRTLFETKDLSQVKQYLQRQWSKILSGRVSLQDFVFAKEVRLGTYSSRSPVLPPAAIVASKAMAVDPRAEPRYAERIPYVVVHGEPGARLVDMVVDPLTLIDQPSLRLHDTYYITKQIIPACQRIFMLVGADLKAWFADMPRVYRPPVSKRVSNLAVGTRSTKWDPEAAKQKRWGLKHGTIDQYYLSRHCTICGESTRASQLLCGNCANNPQATALLLPGRTSRLEREYKHILAICRHCGAGDDTVAHSLEEVGSIACVSLDCPVFFERRKLQRELEAAAAVATDLHHYPRLCF